MLSQAWFCSALVWSTCSAAERSLSWKEGGTGLRPRDSSPSCRQQLGSNALGQIIIAIFCSNDKQLASLLPAPQEARTTIPHRPWKHPPLDPPVEAWQGTDSYFVCGLLLLMDCLPRAQPGGDWGGGRDGRGGAKEQPQIMWVRKVSKRSWHFSGSLDRFKGASPTKK